MSVLGTHIFQLSLTSCHVTGWTQGHFKLHLSESFVQSVSGDRVLVIEELGPLGNMLSSVFESVLAANKSLVYGNFLLT